MEDEKLASQFKALGHIIRLKILMVLTDGEEYLSKIAKKTGVSRALAKIHLNKLREADLVETRVVLLEDEAKALRFYSLKNFHVELSPELLKRRKEELGL